MGGWPEPEEVLREVCDWAQEQSGRVPSLERLAVFGSDGRGSAGVGSDLDLLLIVDEWQQQQPVVLVVRIAHRKDVDR